MPGEARAYVLGSRPWSATVCALCRRYSFVLLCQRQRVAGGRRAGSTATSAAAQLMQGSAKGQAARQQRSTMLPRPCCALPLCLSQCCPPLLHQHPPHQRRGAIGLVADEGVDGSGCICFVWVHAGHSSELAVVRERTAFTAAIAAACMAPRVAGEPWAVCLTGPHIICCHGMNNQAACMHHPQSGRGQWGQPYCA